MATLDTERSAFLAAITVDPYDLVCRKVFADWLDEHDEPEEADKQRGWTVEKQEATEYMEELAGRLNDGNHWEIAEDGTQALTVDHLIAIGQHCSDGSGFCFGFDDGPQIMREGNTTEKFWYHWQVLTGVDVAEDVRENTYFRCAC